MLLSIPPPWLDPLKTKLLTGLNLERSTSIKRQIKALNRDNFSLAFTLAQSHLNTYSRLDASIYCAALAALGLGERKLAESLFTRALYVSNVKVCAAQQLMNMIYTERRFTHLLSFTQWRISQGGETEDYFMLGIAKRALGDFAGAKRELEVALDFISEENPNLVIMTLTLAQTEMKCDLYQSALPRLHKLVIDQPYDPRGRSLRARCYEKIGEIDQALTDAQFALKLDPKNPKIHELMGDLLSSTNPKKACRHYQLALLHQSPSPLIYIRIADLAEQLGNFQEGISAIEAYLQEGQIDQTMARSRLKHLRKREEKRISNLAWYQKVYERWR